MSVKILSAFNHNFAGGTVQVVTVDEANARVYVGGDFTSVDGFTRNRLAAFDLNTGDLLPWAPSVTVGLGPIVNDLIVVGSDVYFVGFFSQVNATARNNAAAVDINGTLLSWDPDIGTTIGIPSVMAIRENSGIFYVGGFFNQLDFSGVQVSRRGLAAVDINGDVTAFDPQVLTGAGSGTVNALQFGVDGNLYFGGLFDSVTATSRTNLAALDTSGSLLAWAPTTDSSVLSLAAYAGALFAGGTFTSVTGANGTLGRISLASFDYSANINAYDAGLNSGASVRSIAGATNASTIGIAGNITSLNNGAAPRVDVAYTDFDGLARTFVSNTDTGLDRRIRISGKRVFLSGSFTTINGVASENFAVLEIDELFQQTPIIPEGVYLLRKNNTTLLRWQSVARAFNGDTTTVTGYRIYRSNNQNLETFDLISTITAVGAQGLVDTTFSETIEGYFAYGVTAFNDIGEGEMAVVEAVNSDSDLDPL